MEKNFAYWSEYTKLGLKLRKNRDFLYSKLQCSQEDVLGIDHEIYPASPLYTIRFCNAKNYANWLAVANEDGTVCLHDSNLGRGGNVKSYLAHYNAIFDLVWLENDVKLVTSSGDQSALLWDLGRGEAVPIVRMVGHQGSVKAVACKPGDPNVFATGARDGDIMLWDIRSTPCRTNVSDDERFRSVKADDVIKFSHLKSALHGLSRQKTVEKALQNSQCISSVVFQDALSVISCSSTDKTIKIWDTRKTYSAFKGIPTPVHSISRESHSTNRVGYTSLVVSPCRSRLYAYCTDAKLYAYNIGAVSSEPVAVYRSPGSSSFFCKINLSPDGRFLSSGSSDGNGFIWSVDSPEQVLVSLKGHAAEVTCVDWCRSGELKLASCSDDGTFRIWKVNTESKENPSCPESEHGIGGRAVPPKDVKAPQTRKKFFTTHDAKTRKRRCSTVDASPQKLVAPSPKKLCVTPQKVESFVSELPNYVVDGRSPHEPSRRVAASPAGDWLRRLIAATPPQPAKTSTKKNRRTPNQAGKSSARGNLLRYFKKSDETTSDKSKENLSEKL